jgi:hypothetical protein
MSKSSYPLRRWLKSMTTFSEIQEEKKNAKKMDHKIPEEPKGSVFPANSAFIYFDSDVHKIGPIIEDILSYKPGGLAQDHSHESSKPSISESDDLRGIKLGAERRFQQRRDWFDAGTTSIRKGIRRFLST